MICYCMYPAPRPAPAHPTPRFPSHALPPAPPLPCHDDDGHGGEFCGAKDFVDIGFAGHSMNGRFRNIFWEVAKSDFGHFCDGISDNLYCGEQQLHLGQWDSFGKETRERNNSARGLPHVVARNSSWVQFCLECIPFSCEKTV